MKIHKKNQLAGKLTRVILVDEQRNATVVPLKELTTITHFRELNKVVQTDVDSLKQKVIERLSQEKELIEAFNELRVDDVKTRVVSLQEYERDTYSFSLDGELVVTSVEIPNTDELQMIALDYKATEMELEKLKSQGKASQKAKVTYRTFDEPMEGNKHGAVRGVYE